MAVDTDESPGPEAEPSSEVVVSLASEVHWALLAASRAQARARHLELTQRYDADPSLRARVSSFWEDGSADYDELIVLAHFGGVLTGEPPLSDFLEAVRDASGNVPPELRLGSETASHRARLLARLARLRRDRALRDRYTRLVEQVWSPLEGNWRNGLPALVEAKTHLQGLLADGASWLALLPPECDPYHFEQLRQAPGREIVEATPRLLALSHFAAKLSVVDVNDVLFVSFSPPVLATAERDRAALLGRQVRAIADPTRLALLRLLASGARRVGDLALQLSVSQPTVSSHVKVLRESGIVRAERREGRLQLLVDREALEQVLAEVAKFVEPPSTY